MGFAMIKEAYLNEAHNRSRYKMGLMREYLRIPNNVTLVATINHEIGREELFQVLNQLSIIHPLLSVKIVIDEKDEAWYINGGVKPFLVEVTTEENWINVVEKENTKPFDFTNGPLIRFYLLKSDNKSHIIMICHHAICDGISLTYLINEIVFRLGDPEMSVQRIEPTLPVNENFSNVPLGIKLKLIFNRIIFGRINRKWNKKRVTFDEEDYKNVHTAYHKYFRYRIINAELSKSETSYLINKCRENGVTVNSALCAAFFASRDIVRNNFSDTNNKLQIAVNLRDQLKNPTKNGFGYFAGCVNIEFEYLHKKSFWKNVSLLHQTAQLELRSTKTLEPIIGYYINPTLTDAINFATYGRWVTEDLSSYEKLSKLIESEDNPALTISNSLIANMPNLIMSNLGNIPFNNNKKGHKIEKLNFITSPSPFLEMEVTAVTANDKLTLNLNLMEPKDENTEYYSEMKKIIKKTVEILIT